MSKAKTTDIAVRSLRFFRNQLLQPGGLLLAMLFLFFFFVRIAEYLYVTVIVDQPWEAINFWSFSIYHDFVTAVVCCFYFICIQLVLAISKVKPATTSLAFWVVISFLQAILTAFYISSGRLLGEDFFRYSTGDLLSVAGTGINLWTVIALVVVIGLSVFCFKLMHYLRRLNLKKHWISYLCSFLGVVSIIVWNNNKAHLVKRKDYGHFTDISQYYLGNAKIPFFFHAVDRHFFKEKTFEYAMDEVKKYSAQYIGRNPGHPNPDYPFASTTPTKSTLTPYFKTSDTLPNIVIIIAESLSSAFSGPTNYLGSYTPFLDSLSEHSLFWPNALSCAERSYGALPNILGSLPFGANERGLINEPALKELYYNTFISAYQNAYTSAFFYTGWGGFENTESFMKISGVNHTSTRDELQKRFPEEKEFGWGYRDVTMYKAGIEYISNLSGPHLSTFLTVSIHQPFDQEPENLSTEEYLTSKSYPYGKITNEKIASTIYQCDDAMKYFIQNLQSDPSYKNTIFIITGDHAIGGFVGQRSPLELFNVPLIIYSPLLTKGKTFWPVVTHRDILPSLLGLMNTNFDSPATANFAITGNQLDTASTFQSNVSTSLSLFLEEAPNYLEGRHFYFQGDAYEISDSLMNVKKIKNDTILNTLHDRMYEEKLLNSYVIDKDKLTLP